jgi:hypothetical protein
MADISLKSVTISGFGDRGFETLYENAIGVSR